MAAEAEAYFQSQNIRELFRHLLECVGTDRPGNPKAYLVSKLADTQDLDANSLLLLLKANQRISSELTPDSAAKAIIEETCSFLACERATLFIHNPRSQHLVSIVGKNVKGLVLPDTGGLTGTIFASETPVNIPDAYADPRFNPQVDQNTGYTTRSILGAQILDNEHKPIGVLMAINKKVEAFTPRDESLVRILAEQAGITYHNAWAHEVSEQNERRARALLNMVKALQKDLPAQSFAYGLSHNVRDLIGAHGCSIFLVDYSHQMLLAIASDSIKELRLPLTQSIAGSVALSGIAVNLDKASLDSRYNEQVDQKSSFLTDSLLAVPIFDSERKTVVGVIEALNKRLSAQFGDLLDYDSFNEADLELLELFGEVIGRKISDAFSALLNREETQEVNEGVINFQSGFGKSKKKTLPPGAIPEGEEGGD